MSHQKSGRRPMQIALGAFTAVVFIAFLLAGSGCNAPGGSTDQPSGPDASPSPNATTRLFVANTASDSVVSFGDPKNVNGNVAPDRTLEGSATQLGTQKDVLVNGAGELLVLSRDAVAFGERWISVYDNALQISGNQAPLRKVQGDATGMVEPDAMALLADRDLLFVTDTDNDNVLVFEGTSTASFDGNLAPVRTFSSPDLNTPLAINFGPDGDLYLTNRDLLRGDTVVVFSDPASLDGVVDATRVIDSDAFDNADLFDVFVDQGDTMYVLDDNGFIYIFDNASEQSGLVSPTSTLEIPAAVFLRSIHVDSSGTAYIGDENQQIFSYDNIAGLNGAQAPDRTISGGNTGLVGPRRLFLLE